jgi:acetyltransferase-like isoleucine patch superfamily enzyme
MTLDSSKATIDVASDFSGYVYVNKSVGDSIVVDEVIYIVCNEKIEIDNALKYFDVNSAMNNTKLNTLNENNDKIITKKAQELILQHNLDLSLFSDDVITEGIVTELLKKKEVISTKKEFVPNYNKPRRIAFIGAGRGLEQILDIIYLKQAYIPVFAYDDTDNMIGKKVEGVEVVGKVDINKIADDYLKGLFDTIIITVSTSIEFRKKIFTDLKDKNIPFDNIIHPTVTIGHNVRIGDGNVIFANCCISCQSQLGHNNFISAYCNIEHHNYVGSHNTYGPGVLTSGSVSIGNENKFGTGIFIEPKINIGNKNIIASGTVLTTNIKDKVLVYSDKTNKTKSLN